MGWRLQLRPVLLVFDHRLCKGGALAQGRPPVLAALAKKFQSQLPKDSHLHYPFQALWDVSDWMNALTSDTPFVLFPSVGSIEPFPSLPASSASTSGLHWLIAAEVWALKKSKERNGNLEFYTLDRQEAGNELIREGVLLEPWPQPGTRAILWATTPKSNYPRPRQQLEADEALVLVSWFCSRPQYLCAPALDQPFADSVNNLLKDWSVVTFRACNISLTRRAGQCGKPKN